MSEKSPSSPINKEFYRGYKAGEEQTLAQVEKIIDELEKDELSARVSFACDKLRKEIKNLKVKHD